MRVRNQVLVSGYRRFIAIGGRRCIVRLIIRPIIGWRMRRCLRKLRVGKRWRMSETEATIRDMEEAWVHPEVSEEGTRHSDMAMVYPCLVTNGEAHSMGEDARRSSYTMLRMP